MAAPFARYEEAGPILLAKTPPATGKAPPQRNVWQTLYSHVEGRLGSLRTWRYSWWVTWAQIARVLLPYRYHWVVTANTMNRGRPVNDAIIDSTGTLAMQVCAAGLFTGLMSPSRPWFRLAPNIRNYQVDEEAQAWLDEVTNRVLTVLGGSNFYTEAAQLFKDVATFGTSPMIIYEDEAEVIRAYVPCAGEYFLGVGGKLTIDTLYREYVSTVEQIVDFFGLENCPQQVREHWEQGGASLQNEFIVAHAIEPNFALSSREGGRRRVTVVPGSFPYREVYWLRGQKTEAELSRRGFHEAPFVAARWSKTSNDAYGRGPGHDAYGDCAQLQIEQSRKGEYIDKGVRPPMAADIKLRNEPSSILPGDITYVNGADGKQTFYPVFEVAPTWMPALTEDIKEVQNRINRTYFTDVFLMISQMEGVQPRNELELAMRQGERIQLLGPVIELFESEVAGPVIRRIAGIMARRGLLPPMPESLRGVPIGIEYVSEMKQAQRASKTVGLEQWMRFGSAMAEAAQAAGVPSPLRIADLDEAWRQYGDAVGVAAKLMKPEKIVAAEDEQRAHMAQANQTLAATLPAVQAAEGLSKIDVGGGQNAIQAMLGTRPAAGSASV